VECGFHENIRSIARAVIDEDDLQIDIPLRADGSDGEQGQTTAVS
jgi:hypothetical protein